MGSRTQGWTVSRERTESQALTVSQVQERAGSREQAEYRTGYRNGIWVRLRDWHDVREWRWDESWDRYEVG